jgi:hypothetical protein
MKGRVWQVFPYDSEERDMESGLGIPMVGWGGAGVVGCVCTFSTFRSSR